MSRPPLYRLRQLFSLASALSLVALVLAVVTAGVSAGEFVVGAQSASNFRAQSTSYSLVANEVIAHANYSIPNAGFYSIGGLTMMAVISNSSIQPGPVAVAHAGPVTIPGGSHGTLALVVPFNLSSPAGTFLLTHDAQLATALWVNGTYAVLFPVSIATTYEATWGAPFARLAFSAGAPASQSNGTVQVAVTLSFENHASITLAGVVRATVVDPHGDHCGSAVFPILNNGGPETVTAEVWIPTTCPTSGDTVVATVELNGLALPLPPEPLP